MRVAALCAKWGAEHDNVGLVVGATDTEAMANIRKANSSIWFLAPGIGAQGGDLEAAVLAGKDPSGSGILFPISRGISKAADPKKAAEDFRAAINQARRGVA